MRHRMWSSTSPRRRAAAMAESWPSCSVVSWPMPRAPMMRPSASVSGAAAKARQMPRAVRPFQPGAAAAHRAGRAERVEAGWCRRHRPAAAPPAGRAASGRPAQRRIGRDEHEPAPGIGFEGEVGGQRDQVAPAVAAVQQRRCAAVFGRFGAERSVGGGSAPGAGIAGAAASGAGPARAGRGRDSVDTRFMVSPNPRYGPGEAGRRARAAGAAPPMRRRRLTGRRSMQRNAVPLPPMLSDRA